MTYELHLHIETRELFADGALFGEVGSYERIVGRAEVFWLLIPCITKKWSISRMRHKMNEAAFDTRLMSIS